MKLSSIFGSFAALLLCFSCSNKEIQSFPDEALVAKLQDSAGASSTVKEVLGQYQGKPTILKIWAGWCGDCIKSMPHFNEFANEHPEFNYVLFSVDYREPVWKNAIAKHNIQGDHYLLDDAKDWKTNPFTKNVNLNWIPRYIVLDAKGNIISTKQIVNLEKSKKEVLSLIE